MLPNYAGFIGLTGRMDVGQLTPDQVKELTYARSEAFIEHCARRRAAIDSGVSG